MKKIMVPLLLCLLVLSGCGGNPLPAGMDEEEVIQAGIEVVKAAGEGDYDTIYNQFRTDVQEGMTQKTIRDVVEDNTAGCGYYIQVEDTMATGQESDGESYGVAVLYAKYSKGEVLYRVAFDVEMNLIGLSVTKQ